MAGHSQFKNIMYRKGAQDSKKAKLFARIGREIIVSLNLGADPQFNPRLRSALISARTANMPNENINRLLKRGTLGNEDVDSYNEIIFEGFIGGIAFIIETITNNRNRTVPEIRSIFSKFCGTLGESGSVVFMFNHFGKIFYSTEKKSFDEIFDISLNFPVENVELTKFGTEIFCKIENFGMVRDGLIKNIGDPDESEIIWQAKNFIEVESKQVEEKFMKIIDVFDENDDVQNVFSNFMPSFN